ncbi:hypothetical protein [uncultured Chryseobacterium sp.]|uniref:hypothetical protein n=1 Tax=uncultured Chryseobacterium sp. TaxID=259322 RepID=UPI0025E4C342|nr:hypothetical protein [uncultured Chryseobacterium sp.]
MKATIKGNSNENAEFGVDSRYQDSKERESDSVALMEARLKRMKNLSKEQIMQARLIQLKLRMENYIHAEADNTRDSFTGFLEAYIDTLYSKRTKFANDINISDVLLSQIINRHREAGKDFMLKLMIHSEKIFNGISDFKKETWYQICFQEKIREMMATQKDWRPEIEKQVKLRELN